ncbi:MAG: TIGR03915 family putative DNA repair protein [Treponema sp.]|jgi:hypothetical protein|nr:TIGR03915 family putative DNA repair protein [Treponema sp.]
MIESVYDGSLDGLFTMLDGICRDASAPGALTQEAILPDRIRRVPQVNTTEGSSQPELFSEPQERPRPIENQTLHAGAEELFEVSARAYDEFLHAWMSELPIEAEIIRFGWKVIAAARDAAWTTARGGGGVSAVSLSMAQIAARAAAEKAGTDRGDPVVRTVLAAAFKARHEVDRFRGLLRFTPNPAGLYIAHCAPDHFILPALGQYFTLRFGETSWAIIDEKRRLCLLRAPGEEARLETGLPEELRSGETRSPGSAAADPWEAWWRHYHHSIHNESRHNPKLQKQFMPIRYWKYLPEVTP